jgi:hypothetical protein
MPVRSDGKKDRISATGFLELIRSFGDDVTVVVERPAGSKSLLAAVSMADSFARIDTALELAGVRRIAITARTWQKMFWAVPKMAEGSKFNTKAAALKVANELWPSETWLPNERCRVPHDGMVDAALIAEYARRTRL